MTSPINPILVTSSVPKYLDTKTMACNILEKMITIVCCKNMKRFIRLFPVTAIMDITPFHPVSLRKTIRVVTQCPTVRLLVPINADSGLSAKTIRMNPDGTVCKLAKRKRCRVKNDCKNKLITGEKLKLIWGNAMEILGSLEKCIVVRV